MQGKDNVLEGHDFDFDPYEDPWPTAGLHPHVITRRKTAVTVPTNT